MEGHHWLRSKNLDHKKPIFQWVTPLYHIMWVPSVRRKQRKKTKCKKSMLKYLKENFVNARNTKQKNQTSNKPRARWEAYTKRAFLGTFIALNTINPHNVTSCIYLYIVVPCRCSNPNFSIVKPTKFWKTYINKVSIESTHVIQELVTITRFSRCLAIPSSAVFVGLN